MTKYPFEAEARTLVAACKVRNELPDLPAAAVFDIVQGAVLQVAGAQPSKALHTGDSRFDLEQGTRHWLKTKLAHSLGLAPLVAEVQLTNAIGCLATFVEGEPTPADLIREELQRHKPAPPQRRNPGGE